MSRAVSVPISYAGNVVAFVDDVEVRLVPAVAVLEDDHPKRRFVELLCLVGWEMQHGPAAEPYDELLAAFYARFGLMPDDEFDRLDRVMTDAQLAEHFNVPLEQITGKRSDRAFFGPARSLAEPPTHAALARASDGGHRPRGRRWARRFWRWLTAVRPITEIDRSRHSNWVGMPWWPRLM